MLDGDVILSGNQTHTRGMLLAWARRLERETMKGEYFSSGWVAFQEVLAKVPILDGPVTNGYPLPHGGYGRPDYYDKE